MRAFHLASGIMLALALAGCTQFPELDETIPPSAAAAEFPALVPLVPLLAANAPVIADRVETTANLEARVAGLRARASALQARTIVDASTRTRMQAALNRN